MSETFIPMNIFNKTYNTYDDCNKEIQLLITKISNIKNKIISLSETWKTLYNQHEIIHLTSSYIQEKNTLAQVKQLQFIPIIEKMFYFKTLQISQIDEWEKQFQLHMQNLTKTTDIYKTIQIQNNTDIIERNRKLLISQFSEFDKTFDTYIQLNHRFQSDNDFFENKLITLWTENINRFDHQKIMEHTNLYQWLQANKITIIIKQNNNKEQQINEVRILHTQQKVVIFCIVFSGITLYFKNKFFSSI